MLPGSSASIGNALVTLPLVRKVFFIGSTEIGRRIRELASRDLKRMSIELGGKSPNIVFAGEDVAAKLGVIHVAAQDVGGFFQKTVRFRLRHPPHGAGLDAIAGRESHGSHAAPSSLVVLLSFWKPGRWPERPVQNQNEALTLDVAARGWLGCGPMKPFRRVFGPGLIRLGLRAVTVLLVSAGLTRAQETAPAFIQELNLVHFCHTDIGFTDHPAVARELHRRYLDVALDAVLARLDGPPEKRLCWTAETTLAVTDWWEAAPPERRRQFLEAVREGVLDVAALPFNQTPFLDAAQWDTMMRWMPEDLWRELGPSVAIQNDVNGFPRAGARRLLDRGVHRLFMGINDDSGGAPFPRHSAFWWRQPDGRRMFVWLNAHYGSGFSLFESDEWRRGPVPYASDTRYRPPRAGDILRSDEASVRAAHAICRGKLRQIEDGGYTNAVLTTSITSLWRMDNDPPFPPLADFVATWNRLGLKPYLHLTTASAAAAQMEEILGPTAPEYAGEWTDWWANGTASAPREVAASRVAKRALLAVRSPLWGAIGSEVRMSVDSLYRDLCLFDEHTWGSSWSIGMPYILDTQAQFNEKASFAFRPMARAEWLLSQHVRTRLANASEGLFLANPTDAPFTGWVSIPTPALRQDYQSVQDPESGARQRLEFDPGVAAWGRPQRPENLTYENAAATFADALPRRFARFWVEALPAHGIRRLVLSTEPVTQEPTPTGPGPEVERDGQGWPMTAQWPGLSKPLFLPVLGDFVAVQVDGFAPRWVTMDIMNERDNDDRRDRMRRERLREVRAQPAAATDFSETPHTLRFTQRLDHPRLAWATRQLELWKGSPRARLTFRLNRISSADPEIFYIATALPTGELMPRLTCGGESFTPFNDQLPGTCRDYFAVDGWADYATPEGRWLWVSRDAPLLTLGSPQVLARRRTPVADPHRLLSMVYNNFWHTNFAADESGVMEFQFDLAWMPPTTTPDHVDRLAVSLPSNPIVIINPAGNEDRHLMKWLFAPGR